MFNTIHFKLLLYYLGQHDFNAAIEVAQKIEDKWNDLSIIIPKMRHLAYFYNITVAYWFGGETKSTIFWLSKVLNFENVAQGQRFINEARIIQLPIYYDCQDVNLENRIESTRKVLSKRKELTEYRKIILSGFRRLLNCVGKEEEYACIVDVRLGLQRIKKEGQKASDLECLLLWCQQKTHKKADLIYSLSQKVS